MEFVNGQSLKDVLKAREVVRCRNPASRLAILDALKCAHDAGVVHRDIKPGNILMGRRGALLADFGIASTVGWGDETLTNTKQSPPATPAYMSPEQKLGPVDHRSDLFSLGVTLRQCLLGLSDEEIRDPRKNAWDGIPSDIREVIERSLAVNLEARWQSADEFRAALEKTADR
jgi:serine/threonine-protein kinase